ncbi:hypothetical protein QFC20_000991 [Naganishia adeliensis]|uniref:Uncharacterized protein n=1 Tax=Naganishia adeliensis TaxID=92952 RepID=A0ACC2WX08_9TREE|nr:hypothetical protein QFC20_000991 [Naganishia adeliensis]
MSNTDYTGTITVDEWQEYHNLRAVSNETHTKDLEKLSGLLYQNFHRYTECYAQEQQTLLARIDDLQIANVRLQDKLLIREQQNKIYEQRHRNSESVPGQRSLNRRASLYDGSWTNSLQSTMVSPFPPTIFSPTVSLTKSQKPSLAVTIPNSGSLSLSTNSSVFVPQQTSITVEVEPTSWSSSSPVSMQWKKREEKKDSPIGLTVSTQQRSDWVLDDVPFSYGNWTDNDFDDDSGPPPATAVSAPAGSIPVASTSESVRYAMVLVDVCNVKFPVEDVLRGREGGYQYIENLHRAIIEQLAKQNLPPVTDPLMVRMIVKQGDYGNLRVGGCGAEQMDEFCLGMRTHTSSMPVEQIPNERFKDTPSALLSTLRMCLNDEDCQLVLIAIDHSLPVYLDDLRTLSTVMSTTKMRILGNISTFGNGTFTCLNIGHVVAPASTSTQSLRHDEDEARWIAADVLCSRQDRSPIWRQK